MTDSEMQKARLLMEASRRDFDACLKRGRDAVDAGSLLSGAVWAQVAADVAFHKHAGIFCSAELESLLLEISRGLVPGAEPQGANFDAPKGEKPRMLHVMTNAFSTGGHTRLVERLAGSAASHEHVLVTTAQRGDLPERLQKVFCAGSRNWVDLSTPGSDLLSRSLRLRAIAREEADLVVLHAHPFDVVPTLAFGVPGGPPVVLLNHSDHTFWVGVSVADVISELRLAGQELTFARRQGALSRILPIPLVDVQPYPAEVRAAARERLNIAPDQVALLTIATSYKYTPLGEYDFLGCAKEMLERNDKAVLLACGPQDAGSWREASEAVGGRIRAFGVQSDISDFHAAADLYLDPFPVASLTSWLETALRCVPVLGRANGSAPIFSDGSILPGDGWTHAATREEYLEQAGALIADAARRGRDGKRLREQVAGRHLMPAWGDFLEALLQAVPEGHAVRELEHRDEEPDDNDFILAIIAHLTSARRSVNTSLRKHGGCFPLKDRLGLLCRGLFGIGGIKLLPVATYTGKETFS